MSASGASSRRLGPLLGALLLVATARAAEPPVVAFLGDSLTAGLGVAEDEAWPARLAERLAERGHPIRAVNGGVSGDTSAAGRRRVDWLLRRKPAVLVVALGANDGLRGLPVDQLERNLDAILDAGIRAGSRVLLLGMRVPPNLGSDYGEKFEAVFARVAKRHSVPFVPFFLDGIGGVPELNQPDGIHPTAKGHRKIAEKLEEPLFRILPKS